MPFPSSPFPWNILHSFRLTLAQGSPIRKGFRPGQGPITISPGLPLMEPSHGWSSPISPPKAMLPMTRPAWPSTQARLTDGTPTLAEPRLCRCSGRPAFCVLGTSHWTMSCRVSGSLFRMSLSMTGQPSFYTQFSVLF